VTYRSALFSRGPVLPLVIGVVLTALLASGLAWSLTGKTATLSIDGQAQQVDFRGGTVADVIEAAGLEVGERDQLVPGQGTEIEDGATVALRRGRELELVVDGVKRSVWVTAGSVQEALTQLGLSGEGLVVSASRSRSIPLDGLALTVSTPKTITIVAAEGTQPRTTGVPLVEDALFEAGVVVDTDDRIAPDRKAPVTEGMTITVVRIRTEQAVGTVSVPFPTERRQDSALTTGTTKVLTAGVNGQIRRTTAVTFADEAVESRAVLAETQVRAPITRVLAVGTKPRPAPAPTSAPRTSTGGAGSLNWAALAQCESGGNPRAVSSTGKYRGLYQFSLATWAGVGGSGDPIDNSAGEQTYRAKVLYNRSGAGQWPECGRRLFS